MLLVKTPRNVVVFIERRLPGQASRVALLIHQGEMVEMEI